MVLNIKYLFMSFLGGFVCKLYDDLKDNALLFHFKNEVIMEMLKGLHYISFTLVSLEEPLFFCFHYFGNYLHHLNNKKAFSEPYEKSLFFSFLLLLLALDIKKVNQFTFNDLITICLFMCAMIIEPLIINSEYSFRKLLCRIFYLVFASVLCVLPNISTVSLYPILYMVGYLALSAIVQCYSLFIHKKNPEKIKTKRKNKDKDKDKDKDKNKDKDKDKIKNKNKIK